MPSRQRTVRSIGVVVGVTIAVLVAVGVLLTISHTRSASQQQRLVVSNYETISMMRSTLVAIQEAEIGQRIYLLTGDAANLTSYERARPRVDAMLRQLEAVTAGDTDALHQIAEFRDVANEKFQELNDGIVFQQQYGSTGRPRAPIGRNTSEHLKQVSESFIEGQRLQLARRLATLRSEENQADLAGFLVLGGAILCLAAGTFLIVRGGERLEDAQRQLGARTRLLQSTLETLHDPILVLDPHGGVVAWNEAFVRLAGWDMSRDPILTREHLLSPRLPVTRALLSPLRLDVEDPDHIVTARASYDGREYDCSRGRMAEGGSVIRCVDVTEKLRDEAALRQGQKMEAVGQLTGGMAHDFNNILQIIQANLDLVRLTVAGDAKALARLQSASAAADRGARLTQQLLAFSRRQPLAPRPIRIARLIGDMVGLLRHALGERVVLDIEMADDAGNATIDPGQLENALLNLAINARDAMPDGGSVRIEVANATLDRRYAALHPDVTPGPYVMVAVSDTGIGMPADVVAQAFDPFFTTKQEGKGTGLGLSMVYGFVRQSSGHVRIDSAIGQGTSVKLYLPRTSDPVDDTESGDLVAAGGDGRILVVEDNKEVRQVVTEMLTSWGYRVVAAENPDVAAGILDRDPRFDLLLTDVVMPGSLSAVELAGRAQTLNPSMAVLLTSGYTRDLVPKDDGRDYPLLAKPYRSEELAEKVRAVLAARRVPDSRRGAARPAAAPSVPAASRPPRRVLLVEDEVVLRMSTADMLERLECLVTGVGSGEEALEILSKGNSFDLLVTDFGLPGISGEELAREVRRRVPDLPVIIASGYGPTGMQSTGVRFIGKPYSAIDLQQALEQTAPAAPIS